MQLSRQLWDWGTTHRHIPAPIWNLELKFRIPCWTEAVPNNAFVHQSTNQWLNFTQACLTFSSSARLISLRFCNSPPQVRMWLTPVKKYDSRHKKKTCLQLDTWNVVSTWRSISSTASKPVAEGHVKNKKERWQRGKREEERFSEFFFYLLAFLPKTRRKAGGSSI